MKARSSSSISLNCIREPVGGQNRACSRSNNRKDDLSKLYQESKDANELLEFKNYELQFRIQELEQAQAKILNKLMGFDSTLVSPSNNNNNIHKTGNIVYVAHNDTDLDSNRCSPVGQLVENCGLKELHCDSESERQQQQQQQQRRHQQQPPDQPQGPPTTNSVIFATEREGRSVWRPALRNNGPNHAALGGHREAEKVVQESGLPQVGELARPYQLSGEDERTYRQVTVARRARSVSPTKESSRSAEMEPLDKERLIEYNGCEGGQPHKRLSLQVWLDRHQDGSQSATDDRADHTEMPPPPPNQSQRPRGGARLAMPVGARSATNSATTITNRIASPSGVTKKTTTTTTPIGGAKMALKNRSKSSLELRTSTKTVGCLATKTQPARPTRSRKDQQTIADSSNWVTQQQQQQQLAKGVPPCARATTASQWANSFKLTPKRGRSASAIGFVTQIPTLIGQSHGSPNQTQGAPSSSAISTPNLAGELTATTTTTARSTATPTISTPASRTTTARGLGKLRAAKSMASLTGNLDRVTVGQSGRASQDGQVGANDKQAASESAGAQMSIDGSPEAPTTEPTCTPAGKPIGETEFLNQPLAADPPGEELRSLKDDDHSSSSSSTSTQFARKSTTIDELRPDRGAACLQCEALVKQVQNLEHRGRALGEQVSELEELENDSRLISQKLAAQLMQLERQFDTCQIELRRSTERESRLQFLNKRLGFELKQQVDTVERLRIDLQVASAASKQAAATLVAAHVSVNTTSGLDVNNNNNGDDEEEEKVARSPIDNGSSNELKIHRSKSIDIHRKQSPSSDEGSLEPNLDGKKSDSGNSSISGSSHGADDSAYSKSSASSDAASSEEDSGEIEKHLSSSTFSTPVPVLKDAATQVNLIAELQQPKLCSPSSSSDESNHREEEPQQLVGEVAETTSGLDNPQQQTRGTNVAQSVNRRRLGSASQRLQRGPISILIKQHQQHPVAQPTKRSPIELALEGVRDLELIDQTQANEPLRELVAPVTRVVQSRPEMDKELRVELANVKQRLVEATSFNDNLVAELKSKQEQIESLQIFHQQQQQQQQQHWQNNGDFRPPAEPLRRRSIIYINGPALQPAMKHNVGADQPKAHCVSVQATAHQVEQRQVFCQSHREIACIRLDEVIAFLRLFLDKLHLHHGRSFELASDCQKLAMSALVASQAHCSSLSQHSAVVMAGNAATCRSLHQVAAFPPPHDTGKRQQQQQEAPPPPPRRRPAAGNRMTMIVDEDSDTSRQKYLTDQANNIATKPVSAAPSALQVAKQTLLSIVPIYYNNNNNHHHHHHHNDNNNAPTSARKNNDSYKSGSGANVSVLEVKQLKSSHLSSSSCTEICVKPIEQKDHKPHNHHQTTQAHRHLSSKAGSATSSFSEQIERYRVHFNGQLLDLLTRQNWCESIITEKLKTYHRLADQVNIRPTLACRQSWNGSTSMQTNLEHNNTSYQKRNQHEFRQDAGPTRLEAPGSSYC